MVNRGAWSGRQLSPSWLVVDDVRVDKTSGIWRYTDALTDSQIPAEWSVGRVLL